MDATLQIPQHLRVTSHSGCQECGVYRQAACPVSNQKVPGQSGQVGHPPHYPRIKGTSVILSMDALWL